MCGPGFCHSSWRPALALGLVPLLVDSLVPFPLGQTGKPSGTPTYAASPSSPLSRLTICCPLQLGQLFYMGYTWPVKSYGTGQDHRSQFTSHCRVGSFSNMSVVCGAGSRDHNHHWFGRRAIVKYNGDDIPKSVQRDEVPLPRVWGVPQLSCSAPKSGGSRGLKKPMNDQGIPRPKRDFLARS